MKRIDLPPTNEELINLIKTDPIGRNADLTNMLELLDSIEGPFTVFLDSGWGTGKTFFVKQLELVLRKLNPQLSEDEETADDLRRRLRLKEEGDIYSILPVYYNAWESDYWDDPLPSLLLCLQASADVDLLTNNDVSNKEVLKSLFGAVMNTVGFEGFERIVDVFSGEDLLEQYKARQTLREKVGQFVAATLEGHANRLLLIIDELDRCKPTFAVKLLETIKTLFDDDRVVVLSAVNVTELAHSVEGLYGPGIDGCRYLSRFYDIKLMLPLLNEEKYLAYQSAFGAYAIEGAVAREIISSFEMSLRDINRYQAVLKIADEASLSWPECSGQSDAAIFFARNCLVQILLAVNEFEPRDYEMIRAQKDGAVLLKYIQMSPAANRQFEYVLGLCLDENSRARVNDGDDAPRVRVAKAFCELIWNSDEASKNYLEAYEMLLSRAFGAKSLKFISRDVLY